MRSPRSRTRWETCRRVRTPLVARPAGPPPITSAGHTDPSVVTPRDPDAGSRAGRTGEQIAVVSIPLALEAPLGVVLLLELEEFGEARMAALDLLARRPAVIGQVIAAPVLDRPIDEPPKILSRLLQPLRRVGDVHIEDNAVPGLPRPGKEALVVLLDEA